MKTKQDVKHLMEEIFKQVMDTRDKAHDEYAQSEDAHANFRRQGEALAIPPEKVLWIFATKHWDGVASWIKGRRDNLRENIRGRIKDLIVYLILLWALVDDIEGMPDKPKPTNFINSLSKKVKEASYDDLESNKMIAPAKDSL